VNTEHEPEPRNTLSDDVEHIVGPAEAKAAKRKLDAVVKRLAKDDRLSADREDWSKPVFKAGINAGKLIGGGALTDEAGTEAIGFGFEPAA
jgi:hypothetical protein